MQPTARINPRSPCKASVGCRKTAEIPILFMVATIFSAIFPLLPTPQITSLPPRLIVCAVCTTALPKPSWAVLCVRYMVSKWAKASRSVAMTWMAVMKDDPSSSIAGGGSDSGGVMGSGGIGSWTSSMGTGWQGETGVIGCILDDMSAKVMIRLMPFCICSDHAGCAGLWS